MIKNIKSIFHVMCWLSILRLAPEVKAQTVDSTVTCLGPKDAKSRMVYLHGFEKLESPSHEERENRKVLERLAQERSFRIALPVSPFTCKNRQRCWSSQNEKETIKTFEYIQNMSTLCWNTKADYSLLGFSNGGYFALKLFKIHQDPRLKLIVGVGSAGSWNPAVDKPSVYSKFQLIVGRKELTLNAALKLQQEINKSLPQFSILLANGGHKLDFPSLLKVFH